MASERRLRAPRSPPLQQRSRTPQGGATSSARGSQTLLETTRSTTPIELSASGAPVLRLRGSGDARPAVRWDSAVVDNEGQNRKKSKVCCIYHRPRGIDESSSESSSSSSDESSGDEAARRGGDADRVGKDGRRGAARRSGAPRGHRHHDHDHDPDHDGQGGDGDDACSHDHGDGGGGTQQVAGASSTTASQEHARRPRRRPSPNAYERQPRYKKPDSGGAGQPSGPGAKGT